MEFSSKLLENAVNEVAMLPGIGKRTAMRLVLHLLKQPANQTQSKPKPQKIDFTSAKENFVQNNIIGENTIFTPKFVLLESLMELNELSKDKEEDLSSDLESIINNIDSFVIDQCAITPNDSSCGQIPQNIQPITTTKSKSKKSKGFI